MSMLGHLGDQSELRGGNCLSSSVRRRVAGRGQRWWVNINQINGFILKALYEFKTVRLEKSVGLYFRRPIASGHLKSLGIVEGLIVARDVREPRIPE
jgi:hypothetical protein